MTWLEVTLLVEHPVVRQKDLVVNRLELAVVQERGGIENRSVVVDEADHSGDPLRRSGDQFELLEVVAHERALEDEVLGWVAGQHQLREADDVGALLARAADPVDDQARVALEVADDRVDLRERDSQWRSHVFNFDLRAWLALVAV